MLTESERNWLRERKPIKHTCEDCWTKKAIKSMPFLHRDRYFSNKNDEPALEDDCSICKWMPGLSSHDILFDCWKDVTWYEWDDEKHLDFHLTEKGQKEIWIPEWGWGPLDFQDAAEFEVRVNVELARPNMWGCPCFVNSCPFPKKDIKQCMRCRIKAARLTVEKEMDRADH